MVVFDDDIFGGMFDMNGDGETDFSEEMFGYMVMEEFMNEDDDDYDFDDFDDGFDEV